MNKLKWENDNGLYFLEVNGYKLSVTDNGVFIWWCCILNNEVIDSSYNKNNPQSMTVEQAKTSAYECYLNHYTKDIIFPDFLDETTQIL